MNDGVTRHLSRGALLTVTIEPALGAGEYAEPIKVRAVVPPWADGRAIRYGLHECAVAAVGKYNQRRTE